MKYIYYPVIRPQAITKSEKITFSKSITNFLLVFLFTLLGFTNAFGQFPGNDNTPGIGKTFTVPANVTHVNAAAWGAGGGGGGSNNSGSGGNGGGGGGAASSQIAVTSGNIFTYTLTAGGTAGPSGAGTGGNGGNTTITSVTPLTNMTANGGTGGLGNAVALNTPTNSGGGSASGGTTNLPGSDGIRGGASGGNGGNSGTAFTIFGTGGLGWLNSFGDPGGQPGAGGGGGERSGGTFYAGGAGAPGRVMFDYITVSSVAPNPVCVGSTITITGTNFSTLGSTTVSVNGTACTGVVVVNTTTITAVIAAGTTSGVVNIINNGRRNNGISITVNPLPAVIAGGSATVCTGASTPAFTSAPGGGTWSVIAGTGTASISAGGVLTGTTAGNVTVRYTLPTGCFVTSGTITIEQTPGAIAGGSATVCNGASTPAFTNPNGGGTWSVVNGTGAATITAGGVLTGTSTGGVTVRYTIGSCTPATFNVTVNPSPNATIGGGALTVCTGGTTPAFTNSVGGGTWSITNGTGSATISAGGIVTGVTAGTATVVYSIGTCTASAPISVITIPATVVGPTPANAAINVCFAGIGAVSSISWTASASATSYDVYFGAGSLPGTVTANVATNTYNTGALVASTTYYWRVVAKNSCGDAVTSATFTFTTAALSCAPIVYCTPVGTGNTYPVSNVTFAGINNTTSAAITATPYYQDFSGLTGTVNAGNTYLFTATATGATGNTFGVYVYFDWNNNGNFEDDGGPYTIGTYTTATATVSTNITIPLTAYTAGPIRFRVINQFNIVPPSCPTVGSLQAEDYSLSITPAPACTEPTAQPTVLVLSAGTPSGTALNGSFTAASPAPQNYLVVMNTTGTAPTGLIMDGTSYSIGSSIGVGNTVVDTDTNTTFIATGLNPSTTYYFFVYSMNAICSGGPLYNTNPTVLIGNGTTSTGAPTYCTPVTILGQNDDKYISRVAFIGTLVETNNTSTFSNTTPGYQDFTGLAAKAQQAQGEGVNMIVESIGGRTRLHAWVDWNKNGTYEASELVYGPPAAGISSTFGFIIPSGTVPGDYRIRVRTFNSYYNDGNGANGNPDEYFGLNFDACQLFNTGTVGGAPSTQYGEAEDYLFNVIQKCDANITSVVDGDVCNSGVVDLIANGTAGTTQIRWYTALTGGASIGTSTSGGTFETPVIAATTTYYCTAWNGTCESFVRTPVVARVNPTPTLTFTQSSPDVCGENAIVSLTAGGDKELTNLLFERFEGGLGAFTNVNSDPSPAGVKADTQWMVRPSTFVPTAGDSWKPAISSGLAPNSFALATSDSGTPPEVLVENSLTSVTLNSTNYLNLTMTMKFYYSRYFPDNTNNADEFVSIQISTNGGGAWTTLQTFTADTGIGTKFTELSYGLNAYINQTNLKVRVLHHSLGSVTGWLPDGVAVDDIKIFGDVPLNTAFVWSGASLPDVYSNPAATTTYVAGSPVVTVYVKPTLAQLEMGSYTFTATAVLSNGCTASQDITILNKSKIWKGSVNNNWYDANNWNPVGIPDANTCVIIPDIANTSNRPSEINTVGSNAYGKTLEVKNNGRLNIYTDNNLTIGNTINVAGTGLIDMENSSSLIQIANVANTGNIRMKRNANIRRQDYVYWSSPVAGVANSAVSPGTSLGFQYKWTPTIGTNTNGFGNWAYANETMVLGKGYCLRGPDAYSVSTLSNYTATFLGVPNNGNITIPISRGSYDGANYGTLVSTTPGTRFDDNWNLVGNPYPSAINAISFLTLNTNIAGFVNIWSHGTLPSNAIVDPFYADYVYNYTPTDYITYNSTGVSSGASTGFNGSIAAGQGFFVSMLHTSAGATENLVFNNTLRSNAYNNGQFYRTSESETNAKEPEKHRIWFDLVDTNGTSIRTLLGYVENATNENDRLFDAFSNEKLSFNVFTHVNNDNMLIQGRKLPFDTNDKVNIGVTIPRDGLFKIALSSVDGLFLDPNQNIYLEDKVLNIIYNLKTAPYSFMDKKGTIKDRFVLRFSKEASSNAIEVTNQVSVYENKVLTVESGKLKIKNIQVFDILGKQLLNKNDINSKTYQLNNLNKTNSLMIVKVTLEDNSEETRKVIY
jgi:hypothetical protein